MSYTVKSVLRFKTEIDIRPIIRSLVSVLRPEIGLIESRLSKIRTNTQDELRDVLILYINIYTYALISRMIFINHGEITFAHRPTFVKKFTEKIKNNVLKLKSTKIPFQETNIKKKIVSYTKKIKN